MTSASNDPSLDQIFRSARTLNSWADRPVEDDTVREIYDLMKWGPTSAIAIHQSNLTKSLKIS